jgi:2-keto-4-pentenoate hydratase/2-oxohepta-3-ene-1,7-dioic acid hydratase in catechol pathway
MKLVVYGPAKRLGLVQGGSVIDVSAAYALYLGEAQGELRPYEMAAAAAPEELGAFIEAGDRAIEAAQRGADHVMQRAGERMGLNGEQIVFPLAETKLHAPYARRCRIMMAGGNYVIHSAGMSRSGDGPPPTLQELYQQSRQRGIWGFYCFPENAAGPDEDIIYPSRTDRLDYEGEVAVILGRKGKDVPADRAAPFFWGYLLQNDISARTTIPSPDHPQSSFMRSKNFDGSIAAGPYVVVGEFPDAQNISWETRVNGEVRQQGNTKDMTFTFAEYVEYMSSDMTLLPGDVISAGTTAGTAQDSSELLPAEEGKPPVRAPEKFLKPGDVVEVSNPEMGTLRSRIVEKPKG